MRQARPEPGEAAAGRRAPFRHRRGFALTLALVVLIVLALVVSLLLDAAVQELRTARGEVASTRVQALLESALADVLASPLDSAFLALPRGAARQSVVVSGGRDTTIVSLQALGESRVRALVTARSYSGSVRTGAAIVAFLLVVPDPAGAGGELMVRRVAGWWWAPVP
jgi:hypothetical protein